MHDVQLMPPLGCVDEITISKTPSRLHPTQRNTASNANLQETQYNTIKVHIFPKAIRQTIAQQKAVNGS